MEEPKSNTFPILLILFALMGLGLGILIWLAPIADAEVTAGQQNLRNIADGMVKASVGAILGFTGARLSSNGSPPS